MRPRPEHLALLAIQALACALCVATYGSFNPTWDEPEHLAAGMELLDRGTYTKDIQHPPLARMAIAAGPYLAGARSGNEPGPSGEQEGREILYGSGDPQHMLALARLGVLPFLVLLIGAVWLWARRWFGTPHALLACLFAASTPPLLGHAGLATLDIPGSALCAIALYWMLRWGEDASLRSAALFGASAGLAVGTKLYAIPYLGVCGAGLLAFGARSLGIAECRREWQSAPRVHGAWLAAASAAAALILAYGGRFETLQTPGTTLPAAIDCAFGSRGPLHDAALRLAAFVPVPLAADKLLLGIAALLKHNADGHLSYLLGDVRTGGWWYFYPLDLAIKTPIPMLLLGAFGLVRLWLRGWHARSFTRASPALCFAAILGFGACYSRINIGIRHMLVLYPFLAIAAAEGLLFFWAHTRHVTARGALCVALLAQLGLLWSAFPDYFPYFNAIAAEQPDRFVVDSDLDWGQDLRRLELALKQRQVHELGLAYRGTAALWLEDLPRYQVLAPGQPATGWIAVSVMAEREESRAYAWLAPYRPVERIGKSIDLYFIPPPPPAQPAPQASARGAPGRALP